MGDASLPSGRGARPPRVEALSGLKRDTRRVVGRRRAGTSRVVLKAHFGRAIIRAVGADARLDVIGNEVNVAATLPARTVSLSTEAFRRLENGKRGGFKSTPRRWCTSRWTMHGLGPGRRCKSERIQGVGGRPVSSVFFLAPDHSWTLVHYRGRPRSPTLLVRTHSTKREEIPYAVTESTWLKPGSGVYHRQHSHDDRGFHLGGWTTAPRARQQAMDPVRDRVTARSYRSVSPEGKADVSSAKKLAQLTAITSFVRATEFVMKSGWGDVPGAGGSESGRGRGLVPPRSSRPRKPK